MYRTEIDKKIKKIVDRIINKPEDKITIDDYTILRDVRCMESEADSKRRMERLMSVATSGFITADK